MAVLSTDQGFLPIFLSSVNTYFFLLPLNFDSEKCSAPQKLCRSDRHHLHVLMQTEPFTPAAHASPLCIKVPFAFAKPSENSQGLILLPEGTRVDSNQESSHKKGPPRPRESGALSSGWEICLCPSGGWWDWPYCPLVRLLLLSLPSSLHHLAAPLLCPL